ncbi:MAG: hypothetical protein ACXWZL_07775 [Mycobacterium sp.]
MTTFKWKQRALLVVACLGLPALPLAAQTAPDAPTTGWVTPTFTFFDFSKGYGDDLTQVLERYDSWRLGDNRRTGVQLDAREFWLVNWSDERPRWRAERSAASYDNQRGSVQFDTGAVRAGGTYRYLRTAADGVEFLYSPNRVAGGTDPLYAGGNVGYFRTFNVDTSKTLYYMGRSEVGGNLSVKSDAMADLGSLSVSYDRLGRSGDRFSQYLLGGGDVQGPADARAQLRWRAYDRRVDETLDTGRFQFTLSPRGAFTLDYQISIDRFTNSAPDYELADVAQGVPYSGNPATDVFFTPGRETLPLQFLPNTGTLTNRLGFVKRFGRTASITAGYSKSILDQNNFQTDQTAFGFTRGRISTDTAHATATFRVARRVGLQARTTYSNRSNDSTFPVPGYFDPGTVFTQPRVDELTRTGLGLEASIDPGLPRSTLAIGYQRDEAERDLTHGVGRGIPEQRSLYGARTELDRVYARFVTRPLKGMSLRLRASKVAGDKTGLTREPEDSTDLYALVAYAMANGASVSGFYGWRDRSNGSLAYTGGPGPNPTAVSQRVDGTFAQAGVITTYVPSERTGLTFNYVWAQTDYENFFFSTNIRRYDSVTSVTAITFTPRQALRSIIDTHTLSINGDVKATDRVTLSTYYTLTAARGDTGSGVILGELPVEDGRIDDTFHTLAVSVDYLLKATWSFRTTYAFDYFSDGAYTSLTGGRNTLGAGVVFGF